MTFSTTWSGLRLVGLVVPEAVMLMLLAAEVLADNQSGSCAAPVAERAIVRIPRMASLLIAAFDTKLHVAPAALRT